MTITISELVSLALYLGGPIFVAGIIAQVWFLVRYKVSLLVLFTTIILSVGVAITLTALLWVLGLFPKGNLMIFQFVNLPALEASVVSFPIFTWLAVKYVSG